VYPSPHSLSPVAPGDTSMLAPEMPIIYGWSQLWRIPGLSGHREKTHGDMAQSLNLGMMPEE
jgi:hypothetical protein